MQTPEHRLKVSSWRLIISLVVLVTLVIFVAKEYGEAQTLWSLMWKAHLSGLLLAFVFQVATYVCDGAKWHITTRDAGYSLKLRDLTKFSVEQLSMNQFIPSVGMAGNAIVATEMINLGVPAWIVAKAMSIDILSLLASYSFMTVLTFVLLYKLAPVGILAFFAAFFVFITTITLAFWHFVYHHDKWRILNWFKRFSLVKSTLKVMEQIPAEEKVPPTLFVQASALRIAIFVLDGLTLWILMLSIGHHATLNATFIALVAGSIGGIVSFLPGGVVGFEALCTWVLVLFGTPLEAALAGTLLLRGFVLWLPLIPGLIFARKELFPYDFVKNLK